MTARVIQRGIGKGRDPFLIRRFLAGRGLNQRSLAKLVGITEPLVSDTIRGRRNHRRTLALLESMGCPREYLYGPARGMAA